MSPLNNKQNGAAMLILMTIVVLVLSSVLLLGFDKHTQKINHQQKTFAALAHAKQALIEFALLSDQTIGSPGIGYLPCPDQNGDGLSDEPCGNAGESVQGWLPWQTLGTKTLRDSDHVCLRYAVSGNYKINPATPIIKAPPTVGHFIIHDENNTVRVGLSPDEYALALIFAPQHIMGNQFRNISAGSATQCGSNIIGAAINLANNYLDNLNNVNNATGTYAGPGTAGDIALPTNAPSVFIQASSSTNFNDVITWINADDFIKVRERMP